MIPLKDFPSLEGITCHVDGSIYPQDVQGLLLDKAQVRKVFEELLPPPPVEEMVIGSSGLQDMGVDTRIKRTRITYITREKILEAMKKLGI